MKWGYGFTWQAVYKFVPEYKTMREQGISSDLPQALNAAAVRIFLLQNKMPEEYNKNKFAFEIIVVYDALMELKENGHISFGDRDSF